MKPSNVLATAASEWDTLTTVRNLSEHKLTSSPRGRALRTQRREEHAAERERLLEQARLEQMLESWRPSTGRRQLSRDEMAARESQAAAEERAEARRKRSEWRARQAGLGVAA
jgi:hypothetical protein